MADEPKLLVLEQDGRRNPLAMGLISLMVGACAGLIGAIFRLALLRADSLRILFFGWAHAHGALGFVTILFCTAAAAGVAAWLVRRFSPQSSGSGIPHVERQLRIGWTGNPVSIALVKFFGGILAIGSGLALGREGPTVQIGGELGHLIGKLWRRNPNECRVLLAAGAGAGLATAFNAPIAGAIFVLEELVGTFDIEVTIATLGASVGAITVSRIFLGDAPDFSVASFALPNFATVASCLALGVAMGLLGVAYNRTLLETLNATARFTEVSTVWRAAIIGAIIALVGWFSPSLTGGGDPLTQQALNGEVVAGALVIAFLIRFALGPVSYAARAPGGLFAPVLTIGSQGGLLFAWLWSRGFATNAALPQEFAVVGMAAFFSAVVRAPVTGIVLVTELTGNVSLLLPMLAAAFVAVGIATLLRDPPIYDSLRDVH